MSRAQRCTMLSTAVVSLGCGLPGTASAPGVAGPLHRDRIVVGGYGDVVGMAASQRMIFVASPSGLAIYDRVAQQWLPPLTEADGYPADRITALVGDPEIEGVWIGALGEVLFYRPAIDQLIRSIVGTRVDHIVFDRADPGAGAYIAAAGARVTDGIAGDRAGIGFPRASAAGDGWTRVSHSGFASRIAAGELPPPERWIETPTLASLIERMPALGSFSDLLTRDEALRSWRPTSATQVTGMSEVWLGTRGGGVYVADPVFNRARHIPFGMFEPGVSALAVASDGIWAASLGVDPRGTGGAAFASSDLQRWRWLRGPPDASLAGLPAYDLLVRDGSVWLATERGIAHRDVRASGGSGAEWRWIAGRGVRRAYALAVLGEDVWAGTDDGLLLAGRVDGSGMAMQSTEASVGAVRRAGTGAVRALLAVGDSLWVGSASGLSTMRIVNGVPTITAASLAGGPVWTREPIVALARSDSVLVAATSSRIGTIDLRTRTVSNVAGIPDVSRAGRLTSLAIDGRTIWVGGDRGAMVIDRTSGLARSANTPGLGAETVFDIALEPDFAWLATPTGLVRVRRMPDGGVR